MKNTRIIEILKTFSEKEFIKFEDFIGSKYFNKHEEVVSLFSLLKKHYPSFESDELAKEIIFEKTFGKKKYNDEKMRTLISNLMKLVKKFLIQLGVEEKVVYANIFLLEQIRVRDQENLFDYEYGKAKKYVDENLYKEDDYYFASYMNDFTYFYAHPSGFKNDEEESALIYKIASSLERFVFLGAMDINYQMLTRKVKMNYKPKYIFLDVIKDKVETNEYNDTPLIPLKYYSFSAIENPENEEHFEICQKLYFENFEKISEFERGSIHLAMVNFCMLGISAGKEKYIEKAVALYKFALERGLYFYNNKYLLPYMFYNIVKYALHIGETKWAFNFIFEYKNKVPPEFRKDVVNTAYGKYYFEIGDFDSALKHINKINPSNPSLKLEVLSLLVKVFYELDYIENVYSSIDSLKHYVKTNKLLTPFLASQGKYFATFMRKMIDLKEKQKKHELDYLRKEIGSIPEFGLLNQKWLQLKIDKLVK